MGCDEWVEMGSALVRGWAMATGCKANCAYAGKHASVAEQTIRPSCAAPAG